MPNRPPHLRAREGLAGSRSRHPDAKPVGITVYSCEAPEAALFRELAPRYGLAPLITDAPLSHANVRLASGNHCVSVGHKSRVPASVLRSLRAAGVSYLSTRSVGCDHIDVECAALVGISVGNVSYSPDSVADYTLMLMLMALRGAESTISRARAYDYRLSQERGRELRDLTVGVVGTGRIGAAVIDRLRGFGCEVLAHDRCPRTAVRYVPLERLLELSDVVTLHIPLHGESHHLLDHRRLTSMRRGSLLVNTGRGSLVDTEALLEALDSGHLGGAALDVVEGEDGVFYADHSESGAIDARWSRLQQMPNVIITPHTAYYTDHALRDIIENTLINCLRFESGPAWIG